MGELLKYLEERYLDEISGLIPLHRLLIFLIILIGLNFYTNSNHFGIWYHLLTTPVVNMISGPSSITHKTTLLQALIAISLTILNANISIKVSRKMYNFFVKTRDMKSYATSQVDLAKEKISDIESINIKIAIDEEKTLKAKQDNMKKIFYVSEICFSICMASATYLAFGLDITENILAFTSFLMAFFVLQFIGFSYYIAKIVPSLIVYKVLLNAPFNFGEDYPRG